MQLALLYIPIREAMPVRGQESRNGFGQFLETPSEWRTQSKSIRENTKSGRAGELFAVAGMSAAEAQVVGGGISRTTRKP